MTQKNAHEGNSDRPVGHLVYYYCSNKKFNEMSNNNKKIKRIIKAYASLIIYLPKIAFKAAFPKSCTHSKTKKPTVKTQKSNLWINNAKLLTDQNYTKKNRSNNHS